MTSPTRSSMTTRAWPTSSCSLTRRQRPSRASSSVRWPGLDSTGSAPRLMTDNAFAYVNNRSLRELLQARGIRHLTTQPYRPRTNGKVERFHQTMAREWGYGMAYAHTATATEPCHTGAATTTNADPTAQSEADPRSAAFTTSVGRTARPYGPVGVRPD